MSMKQYGFHFSISTADVLTVTDERLCQALDKNCEAGGVNVDIGV